jgi:hypothetical protein
MGIIWGFIWAYFDKWAKGWAGIFSQAVRAVDAGGACEGVFRKTITNLSRSNYQKNR